jgi:hypothetical protein
MVVPIHIVAHIPYDKMKYDWSVQTFQRNILPLFSAFKLSRYLPSLPDGVNQDRQHESLHKCVNFNYYSAIDWLFDPQRW